MTPPALVAGLPCEPEERVLSHGVFREEVDDPKNGDSAHKHLKQQVDAGQGAKPEAV